MTKESDGPWTANDSAELYNVHRWGHGYFHINTTGQLCVRPSHGDSSASLFELVQRMKLRGIETPILFRFTDVIHARLNEIQAAFGTAIREHGYTGDYCCVYPIKVNQQRQVVEEVVAYRGPYPTGLEAGSKPELLALMAIADNTTPVICNGFKDAEYIEMTLLAQKMGRHVIPVVEKYSELLLIVETAKRIGIRPRMGMRVKLASRGAGRWNASGGFRSKFGLTVSELLAGLQELKSRNLQDCFELLHFHLGSQVTDIRRIKEAITEGARVYVELVKLGAGLNRLDVGGGLGVDYDGSNTNFPSSMNYSLQEYANDIVHYVKTVCDDGDIPHPTIVTENGRAIVAYHSALVFNVLGVTGLGVKPDGELADLVDLSDDVEQPLLDLRDAYQGLTPRNLRESYHDAQAAIDMAMNLFSGGYLPLEQRSIAETLFWRICRKIQKLLEDFDEVPEEMHALDAILSETYFGNFSLFQSTPDSWAIKQLFPVMPIHRLNTRPDRPAVLGDITCDSDGKIDRFIDHRDVKKTLPLHRFNGKPYYLGIFIVGAYQEILGDLHNLFGDTNEVHVSFNSLGEGVIEDVVSGDTVQDVLAYVHFKSEDLVRKLRTDVESAVREKRLDDVQAGSLLRFYEEGLRGSTYLEEEPVRVRGVEPRSRNSSAMDSTASLPHLRQATVSNG
ncbi:MAG: biosynthetic arginine decarboxylase [Pirellulales bacterium]|nr:biosynthetic arginine decarboxylase [Pirellulales bacterium]